jgi:hypothetical protein
MRRAVRADARGGDGGVREVMEAGGMTWDFDDKERTALHEAGHAVVAWSFGVAVGCLYLDPKTKGGGAPIDSTTHLAPFEQIANWLDGFESEQAFKPPGRKYNAGKDFGEVRRILRENGTSKDEPEGQALRERGCACAKSRLREHESKVRAVARHLVDHHYMDRIVFEAMMRES